MISILQKKKNSITILFIVLLLFGVVSSAVLANGQVLSITPTLFEVSVEPGQTWRSSVRVINSNPYDLAIYVNAVNFESQGERGQGSLMPVEPELADGTSFAEWISISNEQIIIPREQSIEIPFVVSIPNDASPGGHFAALMIGTRPPDSGGGAPLVATSQVVTSLLFARVAGEVVEAGRVRSFRSQSGFVTKPSTTIELRFENIGNVHLQPQGEIVITNMWGKERGKIPINKGTNFGNVLPDSVRKFEFAWTGQRSLADIGRYSAEVTLAYGQDKRHHVSQKTFFWIIPLQGFVMTFLGIMAFVLILRYIIRSYIRRMLILAGVDPDLGRKGIRVATPKVVGMDVTIPKTTMYTAPLKSGYEDFTTHVSKAQSFSDTGRLLSQFIVSYKVFFVCVFLVFLVVIAGILYYRSVSAPERMFEIELLQDEDATTSLSSEQLLYDAHAIASNSEAEARQINSSQQNFYLVIANASGKSGEAASLRQELETYGYRIDELRSELDASTSRTIVLYHPLFESEALELSEYLGGVLISASELVHAETGMPIITVSVGKDRQD